MNKIPCADCGKETTSGPQKKTPYCRNCACKRKCTVCGTTRIGSDHKCSALDTKNCETCGKAISPSSNINKKRFCKSCLTTSQNARVRNKRLQLKQMLGGKCYLCGYSKCFSALHFHHIMGVKTIWWGKAKAVSLTEVEQYPERFELLCANCHAEEHDNDL